MTVTTEIVHERQDLQHAGPHRISSTSHGIWFGQGVIEADQIDDHTLQGEQETFGYLESPTITVIVELGDEGEKK